MENRMTESILNPPLEPDKSTPEVTNTMVDSIIKQAIKRNPRLGDVDTNSMRPVVAGALKEIANLEDLALRHKQILLNGQLPWTEEQIQKIKVLWVLSGPGYYRQPFKADIAEVEEIRGSSWAKYMGRHRLTYAGLLMRRLAEAKAGIPSATLSQGVISSSIPELRTLVSIHAPLLFFNGQKSENQDLRNVLQEVGEVIPTEKVVICDQDRASGTLPQISHLKFPPPIELQSGDEIGVITQAPHLARLGRLLNFNQDHPLVPSGVKFRALPLPSTAEGRDPHARIEAVKILYYVFIVQQATKEPYPYKLD